MKHRDFRSLAPQAQEEIRFKAMAVLKAGCSKTEAAKIFGVTRQAIHGWVALQEHAGVRALRAGQRGRPVGGRLSSKREKAICRVIEDHCPDQLKLPFYLWTREAVGHLIQRRFGVKLSVWTVGRFLARQGFTPQKPTRRAFEQDPQAVRSWLARKYPAIRALARREKAVIFWGDEMGVRADHAAGRSFSPRGKTPVILGTGQRSPCGPRPAPSALPVAYREPGVLCTRDPRLQHSDRAQGAGSRRRATDMARAHDHPPPVDGSGHAGGSCQPA